MSSPQSVLAEAARGLILSGRAPAGMKIRGALKLSADVVKRPIKLPENLAVDCLDLGGRTDIRELPRGLKAYELNLSNTQIVELPDDLQVECRLDLSGCDELERLPAGLTVGSLVLRGCTALEALPEGLDVWSLDLTGCWAFHRWPERASIKCGSLNVRGCTALAMLPRYMQKLAFLNARDCPNLVELPAGLEISGWLDIAQSGLTREECLPESLDHVQLRWAGINVDRRIAFHPDQLRVSEILEEKNAERRRAMLDRFGYPRFIQEANAEVVDEDADPGGRRQLVRIRLEGDEDLVALSCHCPSTGRQYVIRVPPATKSCHHAAAWIAGFDDPNDYHPLVET